MSAEKVTCVCKNIKNVQTYKEERIGKILPKAKKFGRMDTVVKGEKSIGQFYYRQK
ncbi:hypothetical protein NCCP28_37940 [Niallia sp. NCCP-28]|nr:hypothetical protein NCCP28_37940 [Niallia sp. NCCP-28]